MLQLLNFKRLFKPTLFLLVLLSVASISIGQLVMRLNNETASEFALRIKPDSSEVAHSVIETSQ